LWGTYAGIHKIDQKKFKPDPEKGGKLTSGKGHVDYRFHDRTPDEGDYLEHLNGRFALAVRGRRFAVGDIDPMDYGAFDAKSWIEKHEELLDDAKLLATVSKSGGVRLWRFMTKDTPASLLKADMAFWLKRFELDGCEVEVFPDGKSPITLPFYSNEDATGRTLDSFVAWAEEWQHEEDELRNGNDLGGLKIGNSRGDSQFEKLIQIDPFIKVPGAVIRYVVVYDGKSVVIEGLKNLRDVNHVIVQIGEQAGELVSLRRDRWMTILQRLFKGREFDTYSDSEEFSIAVAMDAAIRSRIASVSWSLKLTDPLRLKRGNFDVWIDVEGGYAWFKSTHMISEIVNTGVIPKRPTARKIADVVRALGGQVPRNGRNVPGMGTMRLHGFPLSDEVVEEIVRAEECGETPNITGDIFETKRRRLTEPSDPDYWAKRQAATTKKFLDSQPY
ncbi:MAG: hypothetical protein HKN13_01290, partial [Rhodothermales bacterium]|nr:hypothetical protein [Rhodothermales bacterium]